MSSDLDTVIFNTKRLGGGMFVNCLDVLGLLFLIVVVVVVIVVVIVVVVVIDILFVCLFGFLRGVGWLETVNGAGVKCSVTCI